MTRDEYYAREEAMLKALPFNHYHREHPNNKDERDGSGVWSRNQGWVVDYTSYDEDPICLGDNMCCEQDHCDTCIFWIGLFDSYGL